MEAEMDVYAVDFTNIFKKEHILCFRSISESKQIREIILECNCTDDEAELGLSCTYINFK